MYTYNPFAEAIPIPHFCKVMIKEEDCAIITKMSNHTPNSLITSSMCLLIVPLCAR